MCPSVGDSCPPLTSHISWLCAIQKCQVPQGLVDAQGVLTKIYDFLRLENRCTPDKIKAPQENHQNVGLFWAAPFVTTYQVCTLLTAAASLCLSAFKLLGVEKPPQNFFHASQVKYGLNFQDSRQRCKEIWNPMLLVHLCMAHKKEQLRTSECSALAKMLLSIGHGGGCSAESKCAFN